MPDPPGKVIEVWADTIGYSQCTGPTCRQQVTWAVVVASGKRMCFTGRPRPVSRRDLEGREVAAYAFEANHWAACPDREQFKRARAK